jgi:hypothetical protein
MFTTSESEYKFDTEERSTEARTVAFQTRLLFVLVLSTAGRPFTPTRTTCKKLCIWLDSLAMIYIRLIGKRASNADARSRFLCFTSESTMGLESRPFFVLTASFAESKLDGPVQVRAARALSSGRSTAFCLAQNRSKTRLGFEHSWLYSIYIATQVMR